MANVSRHDFPANQISVPILLMAVPEEWGENKYHLAQFKYEGTSVSDDDDTPLGHISPCLDGTMEIVTADGFRFWLSVDDVWYAVTAWLEQADKDQLRSDYAATQEKIRNL